MITYEQNKQSKTTNKEKITRIWLCFSTKVKQKGKQNKKIYHFSPATAPIKLRQNIRNKNQINKGTSKQRQQKNKDKGGHLVLLPLLLHHEEAPGRCREEDRRAFQKPENIIQDLEK